MRCIEKISTFRSGTINQLVKDEMSYNTSVTYFSSWFSIANWSSSKCEIASSNPMRYNDLPSSDQIGWALGSKRISKLN
jgi:hypothetical protein